MTDKVEQIKNKVKRLLNEPAPSHDSQCKWEDGYWCALYKIEEFIDSLQEEHISENLEEAAKKEAEIVNALGGEFPPNPLDIELIKTIFRHGAEWQEEKDNEEKVLTYKHGFDDCKEHIKEVLLSEVLPCFMHGGEADEVVAKLDEVLN